MFYEVCAAIVSMNSVDLEFNVPQCNELKRKNATVIYCFFAK